MKNFIGLVKKALKNRILYYIISRYATYLLQFINSLFIAIYLGPYYLGIWGFITLVIQYIKQSNFGISHSVNAIVSINKNRSWYAKKIIGSSITMIIGLSVLLIVFFIAIELLDLKIGEKYAFTKYAPFVLLIGIFSHFNSLFTNIFRIFGRLFEIAFNQTAFPVLMLIALITFRDENLLWALVIANLVAYLLSFLLYVFRSPVSIKPTFDVRLFRRIQNKAWYLFFYNTSFYLIVISTRSFVSAYYSVEQFGYFTFAFTLSNVILLFLQAISYLIFPKLLNRLATMTNDKIISLLGRVRNSYILTSHGLVHLAILLFPVFIYFFPQYQASEQAFKLIAITIVIYTNAFGYSGLLIARGKEKGLAIISFISLLVNVLLAFLLVEVFEVPFTIVIISTTVTYFVYVFILGYYGRRLLSIDTGFWSVLNDIFELPILVPALISIVLTLLSAPTIFYIIPLLILVVFKYRGIIELFGFLKESMQNSKIIDF